jgi:hypothetical protein
MLLSGFKSIREWADESGGGDIRKIKRTTFQSRVFAMDQTS